MSQIETSELTAPEPYLLPRPARERAAQLPLVDVAADGVTRLAARLIDTPRAGLVQRLPGTATLRPLPVLRGSFRHERRSPEFVPVAAPAPVPMAVPVHTLCQLVVARGEPVAIDNLLTQRNPAIAKPTNLEFGAFLGVPLVDHDDQPSGCLYVVDHAARPWSQHDAALLADLAALAAEQVALAERQRASEQKLSLTAAAVQRIGDPIIAVDRDWRVTFLNPAAARFLRRPASDVLGRALWAALPEALAPTCAQRLPQVVAGQLPVSFETAGPWPDSWLAVNTFPAPDGLTLHVQDITARRLADDALRQSEQRYRGLIQNALDVVAVLDAAAAFTYLGPSVERVLGYRDVQLLRTCLFDLIHPGDLAMLRDVVREMVATPGASLPVEFRIRHADGSWRYLEAIGNSSLDVPGINGIVVNARDVTDRKRVEQALSFQAFHDPLTGLPNRTLFTDRLTHALAWAARRGESVAVLFMDLDRFKAINDSLGHDAGDQLLTMVGQRIASCLRTGDTVARLGGDEFTVLLEGITHRRMAVEVARRIIEAIEVPFQIGRHEVLTTTSIGLAFGDEHRQPDDLLRAADAALYQAKAGGRARLEIFVPSMQAEARERRELEDDLRRAVERGEFFLDYQPIVELSTGRIVSVEALLRWRHPERGVIPPGEFLLLADECGLALPLLRWVLEAACGAAAEWQAMPPAGPLPAITVNLSARQLRQPGVADLVASVLGASGLNAPTLRLEVTANAMMGDRETADGTLLSLAGLGVRLAIDDFNIGSSSLGTLKHLPVDVLIVDQSFVASLERDGENVAIVRAIVALARTLNLGVIAEGIETANDLAQARALGCDLGQGFYISRPMPARALALLLQDGVIRLPE